MLWPFESSVACFSNALKYLFKKKKKKKKKMLIYFC
jgi:hypothetical protein